MPWRFLIKILVRIHSFAEEAIWIYIGLMGDSAHSYVESTTVLPDEETDESAIFQVQISQKRK